MNEFKPFTIDRPWGDFRQFSSNSLSTVKIITVNPNQTLSLQSHAKREEFWFVISGGGTVEINGNSIIVSPNNEFTVPTGVKHRISAGEEGLKILEISTGEFDEEDIIRYEDKYGRA